MDNCHWLRLGSVFPLFLRTNLSRAHSHLTLCTITVDPTFSGLYAHPRVQGRNSRSLQHENRSTGCCHLTSSEHSYVVISYPTPCLFFGWWSSVAKKLMSMTLDESMMVWGGFRGMYNIVGLTWSSRPKLTGFITFCRLKFCPDHYADTRASILAANPHERQDF
jgi:hypothetical protein